MLIDGFILYWMLRRCFSWPSRTSLSKRLLPKQAFWQTCRTLNKVIIKIQKNFNNLLIHVANSLQSDARNINKCKLRSNHHTSLITAARNWHSSPIRTAPKICMGIKDTHPFCWAASSTISSFIGGILRTDLRRKGLEKQCIIWGLHLQSRSPLYDVFLPS